jgi:opacity protein-like surface antigen
MHMKISKNRFSTIITRTALLTLFATVTTLGLYAEEPAAASQAHPRLDLQSTLVAPLDLSSSSSDSLSYSSSVGIEETAAAEGFNLRGSEDMQPPPRRTYSRPNYHDSRTNADGSNKWTFAVGGGFTLPTGGTHNYATTSWKFQVGAGRNFNKTFGVLVQFDYDNFGMQTSTLNKQLALYNSLGARINQLNGSLHDWSFTLNPIVNYYTSDTFGAYAIGGLGFYHKYTKFTVPVIGVCFDPYYGYYNCQANQAIDWYTSNAFGLNFGLGLTYKFSRWAGERFYAEARYVWTDNSPRPYDVSGATSYFNAFPQASARTTYVPVTFGIRW